MPGHAGSCRVRRDPPEAGRDRVTYTRPAVRAPITGTAPGPDLLAPTGRRIDRGLSRGIAGSVHVDAVRGEVDGAVAAAGHDLVNAAGAVGAGVEPCRLAG